MFAKVENGKVISAFVRLPGSYGNVSGFNNLPAETLRTEYGIYPLEEVRPELAKVLAEAGETEDQNRYVTVEAYGAPMDVIGEDKVTRTYPAIPISSNDLIAIYTRELDAYIDNTAKADRWDSRITCVARASYENPWQAKAIAFGIWMDTCYALAYQILAEVETGARPMPTVAEFIAAMPVMEWPE